jgi:hypothetical protein
VLSGDDALTLAIIARGHGVIPRGINETDLMTRSSTPRWRNLTKARDSLQAPSINESELRRINPIPVKGVAMWG